MARVAAHGLARVALGVYVGLGLSLGVSVGVRDRVSVGMRVRNVDLGLMAMGRRGPRRWVYMHAETVPRGRLVMDRGGRACGRGAVCMRVWELLACWVALNARQGAGQGLFPPFFVNNGVFRHGKRAIRVRVEGVVPSWRWRRAL